MLWGRIMGGTKRGKTEIVKGALQSSWDCRTELTHGRRGKKKIEKRFALSWQQGDKLDEILSGPKSAPTMHARMASCQYCQVVCMDNQ